jgi:hypothetical protein
MTRWKMLDIGAKNWRLLKDCSFLLVLLIVILLILYYDVITSSNASGSKDPTAKIVFRINYVVTII